MACRDIFWWPQKPNPRITVNRAVRMVLGREARMSSETYLERMAVLVGKPDEKTFCATWAIGHDECKALGFFTKSYTGKSGSFIIFDLGTIRKKLGLCLGPGERAILSHSHFEDLWTLVPSGLDRLGSEDNHMAEIVFGRPRFIPFVRVVGYAGRREIPVFHKNQNLNRFFG